MLRITKGGHYYENGTFVAAQQRPTFVPATAKQGTMAYKILAAHTKETTDAQFRITFDALASHDITYVGIVQTARASGLTAFPVPYVLTNCHNSLCAVGGTINADDHAFGLSAAHRYGGEFVPAHMAVIHQYMREAYAATGRMILASDSHTRYGPYGCLAIGEGGPELVKQLLGRTYDVTPPPVWAVHLTGTLRAGVGPQDVALALIAAVFPQGLVKNAVLEFVGDGIAALDMDTRNGIDVMTTETTCLSSVWCTDDVVKQWLTVHGRAADYAPLAPDKLAYYDGVIDIDLATIEPMIALPFHPSNAFTMAHFIANAGDILRQVEQEAVSQWSLKTAPCLTKYVENGKVRVQQGIVAGCAGGLFGNIHQVARILQGGAVGQGVFDLSVYPSSQPMMLSLTKDGTIADLISAGVTVRTAFCGPCFGAGDVPVNEGLSIRHTTRNFPNREGSKPSAGQSAFVALMDARSIAATAYNGGYLTPATALSHVTTEVPSYGYDKTPYTGRVYYGVGKPDPNTALHFGPGIADWPAQIPLPDDIALVVIAVLLDPVTTTDELIPSGETSSYRSNPHHLAEFTLSRRDPQYVTRAKEIRTREEARRAAHAPMGIGSAVVARKPGDGSAREQAASCQRVLGGLANIAAEYATRRYRSNLINWGMLPFLCDQFDDYAWTVDHVVEIPGIRAAIEAGNEVIQGMYCSDTVRKPITLRLPDLSADERAILLAGCLINFYKNEL